MHANKDRVAEVGTISTIIQLRTLRSSHNATRVPCVQTHTRQSYMAVHCHLGSARSLIRTHHCGLRPRGNREQYLIAGQKERPAAPHRRAHACARTHTHTIYIYISRIFRYKVYTDHSLSVLRRVIPRRGYGKEFFYRIPRLGIYIPALLTITIHYVSGA